MSINWRHPERSLYVPGSSLAGGEAACVLAARWCGFLARRDWDRLRLCREVGWVPLSLDGGYISPRREVGWHPLSLYIGRGGVPPKRVFVYIEKSPHQIFIAPQTLAYK